MNKTHSYSKRGVLDTCLRQYFYEYYASAKRLPFDPDRKADLRRLKDLTGVFLLAGDRLHWLIQMHLKRSLSRNWLEHTSLEGFDKAAVFQRS